MVYKVVVTGAQGQVGSNLLFGIGQGQMLGSELVDLCLFDIPAMREKLEGTVMELRDCAFEHLKSVTIADSLEEAFTDADFIILAGARPRGPGMERSDLLKLNGAIFREQGQAIEKFAPRTVKVSVVGNPANTNALIARSHAPSIPHYNWASLSRLDHNRALSKISDFLSYKYGPTDIKNVCIFGNHSATMTVSTGAAYIDDGATKTPLNDLLANIPNYSPELTEFTRKRGAQIIKTKGSSSAPSAARATLCHLFNWANGVEHITSMGVLSDGKVYGVPKGVFFSMPVIISPDGEFKVVSGIKLSQFEQSCFEQTTAELLKEREIAKEYLGPAFDSMIEGHEIPTIPIESI
ncbi:hypothetical protein P9112_003852 [Eukaryota sp. TZLM1-RC]